MSNELKTTEHIFLWGLVCALSRKDSTILLVYNTEEELNDALKNFDRVIEQKGICALYSTSYRQICRTNSIILFRLIGDMKSISQIKTDFLILKDKLRNEKNNISC